ncbi:uncharacterized protein LOC121604706 isoform X2 [Chelmon rostratus]|uniref:uncharacterized protein LOC121604706 isoform X2 n=1 Tax=Chelmon rostratus TaxID=109905 RepID=UPI001BE52539|nr:uncharacterized protein LOC121604706 isoform X2 [Chelmon rostratus]
MLLAEAGCLFAGFILYVSGDRGRADRICALKGSSVDLPCSAEYLTSNMSWYTVHWNISRFVRNDLFGDGNRTTYNISGESNFTLTINDLRESDAGYYCCGTTSDNAGHCWIYRTELYVTDLQVKVIPTTEGQKVTLMCSTSCPLTENPAAYIWYKNREFLYQDWSPWYQHMVSSEEAVRYSCAIKGYEDLRAPEVSVDSVTSTCFHVTYAKGGMCSYNHASEDEPCSIAFPTEVHVQKTPLEDNYFRLTCTPSCPLTHPKTAYRWYWDSRLYKNSDSQHLTVPSRPGEYSCSMKGHEDLHTASVCSIDKGCKIVNYFIRRICAVEGSSVNISSEYSYPVGWQPYSKTWYKMKRSGENVAENLTGAAGHLEYHENMNGSHILRIKKLKKEDSAEYMLRLPTKSRAEKESFDSPGVTLVVTGLKVTMTPSAVVTEGQRVTLTCSTSCPLADNYIWFLNSQPLTLPETQNKCLVLDPVGSQHAGNYSCAVKSQEGFSSPEVTLTVQDGLALSHGHES